MKLPMDTIKNTMLLTTDELQSIISCIVMTLCDKHPEGIDAAVEYCLEEARRNGANASIISHIEGVLTSWCEDVERPLMTACQDGLALLAKSCKH